MAIYLYISGIMSTDNEWKENNALIYEIKDPQ